MKLEQIETPVTSLKGVGPANAGVLAKLAIYTVGDLLAHYPRDWDDLRERVPIASYGDGEANRVKKVHTYARVISNTRIGQGVLQGVKTKITDESATAELVVFSRRPEFLKVFPVGSIISVTGKFEHNQRYGAIQCQRPDTELVSTENTLDFYADAPVPNSGVFPIYPLTEGIYQSTLRRLIKQALAQYGKGIEGVVPHPLLAKRGLLTKQAAVHAIHCPETLEEAENAKRSIIYEELYRFQLALSKRVTERRTMPRTLLKVDYSPRQQKLLELLPFKLTGDQLKVISEINADIDAGYKSRNTHLENDAETEKLKPVFTMARLLQGDVGSGKTLVAFFAVLRIADWGGQAAILSPTEILARQHAENAAKLLTPAGIRLAYLTGNVKAKERGPLLKALAGGDIDLVIGTHALFSQQVQYKDLQLAVIDEQHRFGVLQRNAIIEKGRKTFQPHLLMMSATPIPRTLALTVFGDLDVSVIATMPEGRLPIKTYIAFMGHERAFYESVRKELKAGHQAYFVYPRIEEEAESSGGDTLFSQQQIKSAEEMFRVLSKEIYPEFPAALVHSKITEEAQSVILNDFKSGKIKILVATSVVEVGVDNPNATCMVIEHAERFGLAALHQLRGRVGRGSAQSHCILVCRENLNEDGKKRMKVIRENTDGFVIAEEDLKLRGPGEVSGIHQSGYLTLGIADPMRDSELLEMAREDAFGDSPRF